MPTEPIFTFWHDAVMTHDTGEGVFDAPPSEMLVEQMRHPENAIRVANMKRALEKGPVAPLLTWLPGRLATDAEICRFHTTAFLAESVNGPAATWRNSKLPLSPVVALRDPP